MRACICSDRFTKKLTATFDVLQEEKLDRYHVTICTYTAKVVRVEMYTNSSIFASEPTWTEKIFREQVAREAPFPEGQIH